MEISSDQGSDKIKKLNYIKGLYYNYSKNKLLVDFIKFCEDVISFLKRNFEVYIFEVFDETTDDRGIIGFGINGEEIYREIPVQDQWECRYLEKFFESPGLINLIALYI